MAAPRQPGRRVFIQEVVFLLKTLFFVFVGMSIVFTDVRSVVVGLVFTVRPPVVRWTTDGCVGHGGGIRFPGRCVFARL